MNKKGSGRSKKELNTKSPVEKELSKKIKTDYKESSNLKVDDEDDEEFQDDLSNSDPSDSRSNFKTLSDDLVCFRFRRF